MTTQFGPFRWTSLVLAAALSLVCLSCSSSESDDENLDGGNNSNKGDLGNDDAHEGNGQENFVDDGDSAGGKNSADVNSAVGDAAADAGGGTNGVFNNAGAAGGADAAPPNGNPAPTNSLANATPLNATPASNAAPANAAQGGNALGLATPANTDSAPEAPASPGPVATAAAAPTGQSPIPGGRVRYVRSSGLQVVNAPNGSPVATLEQGDHPLTWEDNGWLRINSTMYVPSGSLSDQGIGRPYLPHNWGGGAGDAPTSAAAPAAH